MDQLSEEGIFIVVNWETVEDMIRAKNGLDAELEDFLLSLEEDVTAADWWTPEWEFAKDRWREAYAHIRERVGDELGMAIGIDQVSPSNAFGVGLPGLFASGLRRRATN